MKPEKTPPTAIKITGLAKNYGNIRALAGIDLDVRPGERFGLIGPDGAGKTTLMRILCGLLHPDEGAFRVVGYSGKTQMREIKPRIGYMPQRFSLYPDLTVRENLHFFADLFDINGSARRKRESRLLKFSRLGPFQNRRAGRLSGGMKQKLALSCALIHTPSLLILDEPTTGVDPLSRREFWGILTELSEKEGVTILVSTPYMDEAMQCDRIAFLNHGAVIAMDKPEALIQAYPHRIIRVSGENILSFRPMLSDIPGIVSINALGNSLRLAVTDPDTAISAIRAGLLESDIGATDVTFDPPRLEDVFVDLLQKGAKHAQ